MCVDGVVAVEQPVGDQALESGDAIGVLGGPRCPVLREPLDNAPAVALEEGKQPDAHDLARLALDLHDPALGGPLGHLDQADARRLAQYRLQRPEVLDAVVIAPHDDDGAERLQPVQDVERQAHRLVGGVRRVEQIAGVEDEVGAHIGGDLADLAEYLLMVGEPVDAASGQPEMPVGDVEDPRHLSLRRRWSRAGRAGHHPGSCPPRPGTSHRAGRDSGRAATRG